MNDPFDLARFVAAQEPVYGRVCAELRAGRKTSHWMWFVFPQLRGLGRSGMARHYGIGSRAEAVAYLAHAVLGARLVECAGLMLGVEGRSATAILGSPDDLKLQSCMTLFSAVSAEAAFRLVLERYYGGERDAGTVGLLAGDAMS